MPAFTRTNGGAAPMEQVGRDLFFKTFTKGSAMTQADLDNLVQALQGTVTVTAIGSFTAGSSTAVNMVIEGADVANAANTPITGITSSNLSF
jgi:hypothetical protein